MPVKCEVFGLFSQDIPQAGLTRMERGRKRQGIIPDFLLPGGGGDRDAVLADLKFITGIERRYPRNPGPRQEPKKAVDRRASLVNTEYTKHASKIDVQYCGIPRAGRREAQILGPVGQRLAGYGEVEGWCFGIWGEASQKVHNLVHKIVESRLQVLGQQPGRQGRVRGLAEQQAHLVGSVRRQISLLAVRANARLLISRLTCHIGPGVVEASKRRQYAVATEWQQSKERKAQALSTSQGRAILKRGWFQLK
jgi:hypothetical protein